MHKLRLLEKRQKRNNYEQQFQFERKHSETPKDTDLDGSIWLPESEIITSRRNLRCRYMVAQVNREINCQQ